MYYSGSPGPVSFRTTLVTRDPLIVKQRKLYPERKCQQGHVFWGTLHRTSLTSTHMQVKV